MKSPGGRYNHHMSTVSVRKTESDGYEGIKAAVDKVIEDLGGLERAVKPGFRVLVKPNFVAVPESRLSGAVTRWEVVLAVCEAVSACGGRPFVAESASVGAETEDVILFCGYNRLREAGIEVIDLKALEPVSAEVPGKLLGRVSTWQPVLDADAMITVPVMKTHDQLEITLGMKNLKGLITDADKKRFHRIGVAAGVCELTSLFRPALEIIDGTWCQEGIGPVFGQPVHMGLVIGSFDLTACEAAAGKIMGYEPCEVPITAEASARGLGCADLSEIEIKGCRIEDAARRFVRAGEARLPGVPESFRLISGPGTCTGCRNTAVTTLAGLENKERLAGKTLITGPCDRLPEGCGPHNTVCMGTCALETAGKAFGLKGDPGCPPYFLDAFEELLDV